MFFGVFVVYVFVAEGVFRVCDKMTVFMCSPTLIYGKRGVFWCFLVFFRVFEVFLTVLT